jgi:hypothetical protein
MQTALASVWTTVRTQLRDSHHTHTARTSLKRELASYNNPADLDDLHAILDRYSDQETREIRRILAHQSSI